jgi:hypothetical protein
MTQVVERLLSKHESMSSNPNTTQNFKNQNKMRREGTDAWFSESQPVPARWEEGV